MPETTENLEESIRRNAAGPKSAEVDGQKVEQHSLPDPGHHVHAHLCRIQHKCAYVTSFFML